MNGPARRWLPVGLTVVALIVLGWVVSSAEITAESTPIPTFDFSEDLPSETDSDNAEESFQPMTGDDSRPTSAPAWIGTTILVIALTLIGAAILAVIGFLVYRFVTTRPSGWDQIETRAASQPSASQMREALQAALTDIDTGGDPRAAVIACWLRLERVAAEAGVARLAAETPTDLVHRVMTTHQVNDEALSRLAEAYHQARYAPHEVTEQLRLTSREALTEVDAQLMAAALREDAA